MKKILTYTLSAIFILSLTGCGEEQVATQKETEEYFPEVETIILEYGYNRNFSTTGEIENIKDTTLTADAKANVEEINLQIGQKVTQGEFLAKLNSADLEKKYQVANDNLRNANATLAQTKLVSEQSINSAQASLESSKSNLENTLKSNKVSRNRALETYNSEKINLGLSIQTAQDNLSSAEENLEKTIASNKASEKTAQTTLNNAISSATPVLDSTARTIDTILGVSEQYKENNAAFEEYLGALNYQSKTDAENRLKELYTATNNYDKNHDGLVYILNIAEKAANATITMLDNSITSSTYSLADLNSHKSSINSTLTSIKSSISSLESAQSSLEQTLAGNSSSLEASEQNVTNAKNSLSTAQKSGESGESQALINAKANYENTLAQLDSADESAQKSLESAQASYDSSVKSAEMSNLNAKQSVNSAKNSLEQAQINLDKMTVKSPFNGVITEIFVEKGEEVATGANLISVEDNSSIKIVAYLSTDEVSEIAVGDPITFNNGEVAKISSIAPSADASTKKYKIEILHQGDNMQAGQFIRLNFAIIKDEKNSNAIYLPVDSINISAEGSTVWKIENGEAVQAAVSLGEIEGKMVEITEGLKIGDEIIINGGRILDTNEKVANVEINHVNKSDFIAKGEDAETELFAKKSADEEMEKN